MNQKLFTSLMALVVAMFVGSAVQAQHDLMLMGAPTQATVMYDNGADEVQGWSFGVCNNPALGTIVSVDIGATTAALNGGDGPDFRQVNLFADGWTVGCVISFLGLETVPPGTGYELEIGNYDCATEDPIPVDFCDTLGSPPVATVIVVGGASITPTTTGDSVICEGDPFLYIANSALATAPGDVNFSILDEMDPARDTQGFSMGVQHDPTIVDATAINPTGELAGLPPDFFGANLLADGWTVGVVYAFLGGVFITFEVEKDMIAVTYADLVPPPACSPLTWVEILGDPPVANVVVVDGASVTAVPVDGEVCIAEGAGSFIRGDCNADSIVNIADGVYIVGLIWYGYTPFADCNGACDANNDGMVDTSDAVYVWNWRFSGGPQPDFPFPGCGTTDDVECDEDMPLCP